MFPFKNFRRNRAIKSYIEKLPRLLAKDYGKSGSYTPYQIKKTIKRYKVSSASHVCYGIALFSDKRAFDQYYSEIGESYDYGVMRSVIAGLHFCGNPNFSASDIASVSSIYGGDINEGGSSGAEAGEGICGGGGD